MIAEMFELLSRCLAQNAKTESRQNKWLQDYRERSCSNADIAMLIAAGSALASSVLTALVLTADKECIDYLLYNRDENSDSSRNFRFFFAREMLRGLIDSWKHDDLVLSNEKLLKNYDDQKRRSELLEILVLSLAYETSNVCEKYHYFHDSY